MQINQLNNIIGFPIPQNPQHCFRPQRSARHHHGLGAGGDGVMGVYHIFK